MLPNLIIIGAQKCGTSALHYYLAQHPDISMSKPKELDFFIEEKNWGRGLGWYEKHWRRNTIVRGEASPNYTAHPIFPGVPEKIAKVVPEAKFIFLVRDPIARIVSGYIHNYTFGRENGDFRDVVSKYIHRSLYMYQLDQFLSYFSPEQILILDSDDLKDKRSATLEEVFRFLGVEHGFSSERFEEEKHQTASKRRLNAPTAWIRSQVPYSVFQRLRLILPQGTSVARPVVDEELRAELTERLKPDADRLRSFSGKSFSHWQV